jgi:protoheme IX farnesyltransferase
MSSTLSRVDGAALPVAASGWRGTLNSYYELTKPRIIVLLLITTLAAMVMAARGLPPPATVLWTIVGGALAAASAGAFNCVYDADIDRLMRRTRTRPVASGALHSNEALLFAIGAGAVSFLILNQLVNPVAAWLSLAGNAFYVFVYTMWLKRSTAQNIVIGGLAGSIPPLVGWAAVTGTVGAPAIALFVLVFLWTPPHFWALALMTDIDYDKAGIPMMPNVHGVERTKREILAYTIALTLFCFALVALGVMGPLFLAAAVLFNARFLYDAIMLLRDPTKTFARRMFKYSLLYLAAMCAAMVADRILF